MQLALDCRGGGGGGSSSSAFWFKSDQLQKVKKLIWMATSSSHKKVLKHLQAFWIGSISRVTSEGGFGRKGSIYNSSGPEQEVAAAYWSWVWWTERLSKYTVIWGKPGPSSLATFLSDLCVQVRTWKDFGLGKGFIWICKGVFWKGAFLKGAPVQRQVCTFENAEKVWMEPFLATIFVFLSTLKIITIFFFWNGY